MALFLETLLFGAFTVTYTMGAWSLSKTIASRIRRSTREWVLLGTSTTMFGLALAVRILLAYHFEKAELTIVSMLH